MTCQNIEPDAFPEWARQVADAARQNDTGVLTNLLGELKCGHDAYHALLILPLHAASAIRDLVLPPGMGARVALAHPRFDDGTPLATQIAIQIIVAALAEDLDNHTALAMTVAEPLHLAPDQDAFNVRYEHFADVVMVVLEVIAMVANGDTAWLHSALVPRSAPN